MTTAEFVPARELPNGRLFHSPLGVFDFQAEGLAELYVRTDPDQHGGAIAVWDTGIGKTVLGLLLSTYLYENDEIDQVMVIVEQNKVREWQADFERFTGLSTLRYHGQGRQRRLEKHGVPHVVITTYETGRSELMVREKTSARGPGKAVDGPLMGALGLRDKRVLWILDEPIKLKNRSSTTYQAYEYVFRNLRRGEHHQRVVGLTATPMDGDIGHAFNIGRLICPDEMPMVKQFEEWFTYGRDDFGRYRFVQSKKQVFGHLFQKIIIRKRKTDPDVIEQFPKLIEESEKVEFRTEHRKLYQAVMTMLDPPDDVEVDPRDEDQLVRDEVAVRKALRITAGHPAAHLHLPGKLSRAIVETVGEDVLRKIPSSKTLRLIERLEVLVKGQGAQVIIFEFFTSIITEVVRDLRAAGFTVGEYSGNNQESREKEKAKFLAGELEILVLSDAGARGINLQNAQYVIEYSSSTYYSNRNQRLNRNNRIDSTLPSTTATTMVLQDSVEEGIFASAIKNNQDLDTVLGDDADETGFVPASVRRQILDAYDRRRQRGGATSTKDAA